jgi:hypothetical protein
VRPFSFQGPMTPLHAAVILARYRARQLIRRQIKAEGHFRHRTLPAASLTDWRAI